MSTVPPLPLPDWANADAQLPVLKRHLRVEHSEDDEAIKGAFLGAIQHWDGPSGILRRSLVPAVRAWMLRGGSMFVPLPPVIEVIGFERLNGASWEAADIAYRLEEGDKLHWSGSGSARVLVHSGYLDDTVPANLVAALKLATEASYNPERAAYADVAWRRVSGLKVYG